MAPKVAWGNPYERCGGAFVHADRAEAVKAGFRGEPEC